MTPWSQRDVRELVDLRLNGMKLIVVSSRAPYVHRYTEAGLLELIRPASGMATALEPMVRACGGVWVAQGLGEADRDGADARGRLQVPPGNPQFTLRRVFLPEDIREGFYEGCANAGLWPLCHLVFQRPRFDQTEWTCYRLANEVFADAIAEEAAGEPAMVFVQDYHFALLPRMLKERNPSLIVGQFWHIPWPAAEIFRVFPWPDEILEGMLGNDLLGFHLREHCTNFLTAVDQHLEARTDHGSLEVRRNDRSTLVRPFPISIDYDEHSKTAAGRDARVEKARWEERLGPLPGPLGIGIDRLDYTKGIPDRLRAIETLLRQYPEYRGKVTFVQIGVPTRENVPEYQALAAEVETMVERINAEWTTGDWRPVHYFPRRFSQVELMGLHQLARFCVVSSLHDGMNLVAKEFVASRNDEEGVLVLSQFAGAATELTDALLFNPFEAEQTSEVMRAAIEMPDAEMRRRMHRLREVTAFNNVYRWAGKILTTLSRVELIEEPLVEWMPAQ